MREENKMSNWEFGILATVGVVVIAVGTDLSGRLMYFLYGEWPYICVGLVILAFFGINVYVHSDFSHLQWGFQKDVEKKLAEYEMKLSRTKFENSRVSDEIDFMRKSFEAHWRLCTKIIEKVDKLLEQKSPITAKNPQPLQQSFEKNVHGAVQEVVGGAL